MVALTLLGDPGNTCSHPFPFELSAGSYFTSHFGESHSHLVQKVYAPASCLSTLCHPHAVPASKLSPSSLPPSPFRPSILTPESRSSLAHLCPLPVFPLSTPLVLLSDTNTQHSFHAQVKRLTWTPLTSSACILVHYFPFSFKSLDGKWLSPAERTSSSPIPSPHPPLQLVSSLWLY